MRKPDPSAKASSPQATPSSLNSAAMVVSVLLNPGFKEASRDLFPSYASLSSSIIEKDVQDASSIVDFLKLLTLEYNSIPVITKLGNLQSFLQMLSICLETKYLILLGPKRT